MAAHRNVVYSGTPACWYLVVPKGAMPASVGTTHRLLPQVLLSDHLHDNELNATRRMRQQSLLICLRTMRGSAERCS